MLPYGMDVTTRTPRVDVSKATSQESAADEIELSRAKLAACIRKAQAAFGMARE